MTKRLDLLGLKFGRLMAVQLLAEKGNSLKWLCICDCGSQVRVAGSKLKSGHTRSCGCLQKEVAASSAVYHEGRQIKHGFSGHPLYWSWNSMRQRCGNSYWKNITVCDEWLEDFAAFAQWALSNGYAVGLQLDRKNKHLGYSPDNCQWLTASEHSKKTWFERS